MIDTIADADGANFVGQLNFEGTLDRYLDSAKIIYTVMPDDWRLNDSSLLGNHHYPFCRHLLI